MSSRSKISWAVRWPALSRQTSSPHRPLHAIAKALESYREAVARDPDFADAWAGEAEAFVLLSLYRMRSPAESFPQAKAAAAKALELDPSLAEAHACLGATSFYYDHDAMNAERELQRAIALKPHYGTGRRWYANYLTARGRFNPAIAQIAAAQTADPQSLMLRSVLGWHLFMARRYDDAIVQLRKTLDIDSTFVPAIHSLALAYIQKKMYDDALALFEKESKLAGESYMVADVARLHAIRGQRAEALRWLRRAEGLAAQQKVMAYDVAGVYGVLGDADRAAAALKEAIEAHESGIVWLDVDPRLDAMRSEPQFAELARRCRW
jgi:tetratricopeptide (TPR) repeat protein